MKRIVLILVTTGFLFVMGLIAWRLLLTGSEQTVTAKTPPVELRKNNGNCDLTQQPCRIEFANINIEVVLLSQPHYLQPFEAEVILHGAKSVTVEQVSLQFAMNGMQMSLPATYLQKGTTSEVQTTRWRNKMMLPVCASGRHDWVAEVVLITAEKRYQSQFQLKMP